MLSAQFGNRHTALGLLQNTHNLRVAISCFFYQNLLRYYAKKILHVKTTDFRGDYLTKKGRPERAVPFNISLTQINQALTLHVFPKAFNFTEKVTGSGVVFVAQFFEFLKKLFLP